MKIKEYWKDNKGDNRTLLEFEFAEVFNCWIWDGGTVWIEEYSEGEYELEHIKTIDQYKQLHKLLTGNDLTIK